VDNDGMLNFEEFKTYRRLYDEFETIKFGGAIQFTEEELFLLFKSNLHSGPGITEQDLAYSV